MDVVAPPKPVATEPVIEPALATPPPQEASETDGEAVPVDAAPQAAPQPIVPSKDKTPKSPGVDTAITATAIIIIVIAGLAVLAYIKR